MNSFSNKFKQFFLIGFFVIALFLSSFASATDWWVNGAAASNGSGTQSSPFNSLQHAINPAQNTGLLEGDTIRIAVGTYKPGINRGDSFVLSANQQRIKLDGGWTVASPSWTHADNPSLTILSGDIGTANDPTDNCYTVLKLANSGMTVSNTVISYLTIRDGYNGGSGSPTYQGGGVYITAGAPRFDNVIIKNNKVGGDAANGKGAGVYVHDARPVFTLCVIEDNSMIASDNVGRGEAAGMYVNGTSNSGEMLISNCIFRSNGAVNGNKGPQFGGGLSIVYNNFRIKVMMVNCLIVGNSTGTGTGPAPAEGGGLHLLGGTNYTVNIINSTIADNFGHTFCGGIKLDGSNGDVTVINLRNSIVWGNTSNGGAAQIQVKGSAPMAVDYSDVRFDFGNSANVFPSVTSGNPPSWTGGTWSATNIGDNLTAHNPQFVNSSSDFHLTCGSPCINKANPSPTVIPIDQFDLNANGNSTTERTPDLDLNPRLLGVADMGAYELPSVSCLAGTASPPDCIVNVNDILAVINQWGACPLPPATCSADVDTGPCAGQGDGLVNVNDLLAVLNAWGTCACYTGEPYQIGSLQSVSDCMDHCSEYYQPYSQSWNECVNGCVEGLCRSGILPPQDCQ